MTNHIRREDWRNETDLFNSLTAKSGWDTETHTIASRVINQNDCEQEKFPRQPLECELYWPFKVCMV